MTNSDPRTNDSGNQEIDKIVTDDFRSQTPAPETLTQQESSPDSEALSKQMSIPQLRQARSRADTTSPENAVSKVDSTTLNQLPQGKVMAQRSKSISGGGADRKTFAQDLQVAAAKARGGTQSGEPEQPAKRSKGIVAFLSRKKGDRGKSPANTRRFPEGVLGKEGARVWQKDLTA